MKDDRTDKEQYQSWVDAVNICHEKGWRCVKKWVFVAPGGTEHDLSAANLTKLDEIESRRLFLTRPTPQETGMNAQS
jgi:hypothetical protein